MNLYQFAGSNPSNRTDPSGLDWWDDDIDSAMNDYAWSLVGVSGQLAQARADMAKGAKLAALYAAAAFLWDDLIRDRDEAILLGLITGGFFARACFEAGTPVSLADGSLVSIESIAVGARVLSEPDDGIAKPSSTLSPDEWKLIRLCTEDSACRSSTIELLRPVAWLRYTRAEPGRSIRISIPEMGIDDTAEVLSIDACPTAIEGSLAGLVTGRFVTEDAALVSLFVDSLDQPIGTTNGHPFYSLDRARWVRAGELESGERLQTANGSTVVCSVEPSQVRQTVYNLEVQSTHTYFISKAKVWVHNGCEVILPKGVSSNMIKGKWPAAMAEKGGRIFVNHFHSAASEAAKAAEGAGQKILSGWVELDELGNLVRIISME